MDEATVRSSAERVGEALVEGNVDAVIAFLSDELRRNPGEVVALLPLPATAVSISSIERPASAFVVVLRVVGETADVELQTRWKDRTGAPRMVEVSHLSRVERPAETEAEPEEPRPAAEAPPGG